MKWENLERLRSFAVVGATGAAGSECLSLLAENRIRIPHLKLLASENSVGQEVAFGEDTLRVDALGPESFKDVEAAFFSVPTDVALKYIPIAVEAGCLVVDDSSAVRMRTDVPLVVPEVNGEELRGHEGLLLATPNCSTTPLALVLKPLGDRYGIRRVVVSTYQSVSGAGRRACDELTDQTASLLNGQGPREPEVFPRPIGFNCLPLIGRVVENGYSEEELKIEREIRKILDLPDLKVTATAVRVPTLVSHALSINVELENDFGNVTAVRELLDGFPGLKVLDRPEDNIYPTAHDSTGSDSTFVGRIRRDATVDSGLNLWVISDNLRKGAALNALQTLDLCLRYRRMN